MARSPPRCNGVVNGCSTGWYTTDVTVSFMRPGSRHPQDRRLTRPISTDTAESPLPACVVVVDGLHRQHDHGLAVTIKRDATPPTATAIDAQRGPDTNGWYNHAVGVTVTGTDTPVRHRLLHERHIRRPGLELRFGQRHVHGQRRQRLRAEDALVPVRRDSAERLAGTRPRPRCKRLVQPRRRRRVPGHRPVSGIDSCTSGSYSGPDTGSASVPGTCRDKAGNTGTASFGLHYDSTPPAVAATTPDRQPDSNGWYNHGLTVTYSGTDATSGIDSCDAPTYDKPDDPSAAVSGRCRDKAGNASAPGSVRVQVRLDAAEAHEARPRRGERRCRADLDGVRRRRGRQDHADPRHRRAGHALRRQAHHRVHGQEGAERQPLRVCRRGPRRRRAMQSKARGTPTRRRRCSPRGRPQLVRGGTTLRWRAAPHATYYNVQLWLRGRKVLTSWPAGPSLRAQPPATRRLPLARLAGARPARRSTATAH